MSVTTFYFIGALTSESTITQWLYLQSLSTFLSILWFHDTFYLLWLFVLLQIQTDEVIHLVIFPNPSLSLGQK